MTKLTLTARRILAIRADKWKLVRLVATLLVENGRPDDIVDVEVSVELTTVTCSWGDLMQSNGGDLQRRLELLRFNQVLLVLMTFALSWLF